MHSHRRRRNPLYVKPNLMERIPPRWTLREAVELEKEKYSVKRREMIEFYRQHLVTLYNNKTIIVDLEEQLRKFKLAVINDKGDQTIIQAITGYDKRLALKLHRMNCEDAVYEMNQRVMTKQNKINALKAEIDKLAEEIRIKREEHQFLVTFNDPKEMTDREKHVSSLENDLFKIQSFVHDAKLINKIYTKMIHEFHKRAISLPLKVGHLEHLATVKRKEAKALNPTVCMAEDLLNEDLNRAAEVDRELLYGRVFREEETVRLREEVEKRPVYLDKHPNTKWLKHQIELELEKIADLKELRMKKQELCVNYEDQIAVLQDYTHNNSLDDLIRCFIEQRKKRIKLLTAVESAQMKEKQLREKLLTLSLMLEKNMYTQDDELASLDALTEHDEIAVANMKKERNKLLAITGKQHVQLLILQHSAFGLLTLLSEFPLKKDESLSQTLKADVVDQWAIIKQKITLVLKEEKACSQETSSLEGKYRTLLKKGRTIEPKRKQMLEVPTFDVTNTSSVMFDFYNELEKEVPDALKKSIQMDEDRVSIQSKELKDDIALIPDSDAPTRADIKNRSIKIILTNTVKKKKKKKSENA